MINPYASFINRSSQIREELAYRSLFFLYLMPVSPAMRWIAVNKGILDGIPLSWGNNNLVVTSQLNITYLYLWFRLRKTAKQIGSWCRPNS
ncbi:hypothetical protein DER46DRAFT_617885 [Fusarium sp. MPI-SDFR-AT-0072]|nr:hypothetical protein DER46DRAFT_617885 [Fusarium sp. MPI-SDFR-AT-0072]